MMISLFLFCLLIVVASGAPSQSPTLAPSVASNPSSKPNPTPTFVPSQASPTITPSFTPSAPPTPRPTFGRPTALPTYTPTSSSPTIKSSFKPTSTNPQSSPSQTQSSLPNNYISGGAIAAFVIICFSFLAACFVGFKYYNAQQNKTANRKDEIIEMGAGSPSNSQFDNRGPNPNNPMHAL